MSSVNEKAAKFLLLGAILFFCRAHFSPLLLIECLFPRVLPSLTRKRKIRLACRIQLSGGQETVYDSF